MSSAYEKCDYSSDYSPVAECGMPAMSPLSPPASLGWSRVTHLTTSPLHWSLLPPGAGPGSLCQAPPSAELHRAALQSPLARAGLPTDWGLCEEICKLAGVQLHAEIVIQGTIRTHQGKHVGKVIQAKIYLDLQLKIFG